jgi:hypothetical protein
VTLCVVGRLISNQTVYLRKYRDTEMRQSFVWTRDRDAARSMTSSLAVRVMRAAVEFCDAPTFALDRRGCIISSGQKILTKAEQVLARRELRASTKAYKNVGKTLQICAEWYKGRCLPDDLRERPRRRLLLLKSRPRKHEVVADMVTSTVARLGKLRVRSRRRAEK